MFDFHAGLARAVLTAGALFRRFVREEAAGVAAVVALGLPVLVGTTAMAVDAGVWYMHSRVNQEAADAVAYSASVNYASTGSSAKAIATARAIAAAYGVANGSNAGAGDITWTVNVPSASGTHKDVAGSVEAIINRPENLFFSHMFMSKAGTAGRAVGIAGTSSQYCILALDTSTTSTLMNPSDTNGTTFLVDDAGSLNVPTCGIAVNGAGTGDFTVGQSAVNALVVSVVGNDTSYLVTGEGGSVTTTKAPSPDVLIKQAAIADPYKSTPSPTGLTCGHTNYSWSSGGNVTLTPGTYCGGIAFTNIAATVTMQAGTYYIDGGYFSMLQAGSITGNNVTIVLTGDSTHPNAEIQIGDSATMTLTAPTTGTYAGLAIFADPKVYDGGPPASAYQADSSFGNPGSATLNIQGALYFPKQFIEIANGVSFSSSICTQIIAWDIYFQEGASFNNSCSVGGAGMASIGATSTRLAE